MRNPPTVLFVCGHNAGRSQMAEAFARHLGGRWIHAESAGTEPSGRIQPRVEEVMREIGLPLDGQFPKLLTPRMVAGADHVITMGCGVDVARCPAGFLPSEDWGLDDPRDASLDAVRQIRDQIRSRVADLVHRLATRTEGVNP